MFVDRGGIGEGLGGGECESGRTSPSRRRILKLRLLILRVGELGKQLRQLPKEDMRSKKTCAMVGGFAARSVRGQLVEGGRGVVVARLGREPVVSVVLSSGPGTSWPWLVYSGMVCRQRIAMDGGSEKQLPADKLLFTVSARFEVELLRWPGSVSQPSRQGAALLCNGAALAGGPIPPKPRLQRSGPLLTVWYLSRQRSAQNGHCHSSAVSG